MKANANMEKRSRKARKAPERFTPLFNEAFLEIFGRADSEPATKPLVNAILRSVGIPEIERIDQINADTSLPGGVECKSPRLDVVVLCDDGRLVDLEAERRKVDIGNKSLFYAAKLLVENTPKGLSGTYSQIPEVIVLMLLEGSMAFPDDEALVSICQMKWDVGGRSADGPGSITLVVAELDKVRARYNSANIEEVLADESLAWLYLLASGYERPEEVSAIVESFPTMEEFAERYGIALGDPDLKRAYDRYWESIMEYNSSMEAATEEGLAKGYETGFEEGREEGRQAGLEEGFKEGREEGREVGREELAAKMRELGIDGSLIEKALLEIGGTE